MKFNAVMVHRVLNNYQASPTVVYHPYSFAKQHKDDSPPPFVDDSEHANAWIRRKAVSILCRPSRFPNSFRNNAFPIGHLEVNRTVVYPSRKPDPRRHFGFHWESKCAIREENPPFDSLHIWPEDLNGLVHRLPSRSGQDLRNGKIRRTREEGIVE